MLVILTLVLIIALIIVHPVSITRFPLSRFSPRAGLLRNPLFYTINAKTFQGLGPKRRESCNGDRVHVYVAPLKSRARMHASIMRAKVLYIYIYIERERE